MRGIFGGAFLVLLLGTILPHAALAADGGICPRADSGSDVSAPPDLYSQNNLLNVALNYYTSVDNMGRTLFCFVTTDGVESPTLHVNPGDTIKITLTNMLPAAPGAPTMRVSNDTAVCGSPDMPLTSVNMHCHDKKTSHK